MKDLKEKKIMKNEKKEFHGKAIYEPEGKAEEYSSWACNLYNGCSHACVYCFNDRGIMAGTLGGTTVTLKKQLINEATALEIFKKELDKCKDQIIAEGALHFNFVSDPCLPQTIDLNWACINYAISQGVPVQVLTKRADWLGHPAVQYALTYGKSQLRVGFSLTGHDEIEPYASPNADRIAAMKQLHDAGIATWASIEPIITPQASYKVIAATKNFCDHYKIGILSGKKYYTPSDIRQFVDMVNAFGLSGSVYWKESIRNFCNKK